MKKFSNKIIRTLLEISENQLSITQMSGFKCAKIVLYMLQLFGYLYSQYETKPLTTQELNYIAVYTQLSPGTFALLEYGHDLATKFFFYLIFIVHVMIYVLILYLSFAQEQMAWIYKILNFFFVNYDLMFLTPLQEISIGMMVCGQNSFLTYNVGIKDCFSNNIITIYIVGITGTLLTSFSGFVHFYFFRNYQFFDNNFLRQFSLVAYLRSVLHQLIQICYYLFLPSLDYIKHTLTHILLINFTFNAITKFPFGFTFEANFFTATVTTAEYFMLLLSIWLFSSLNSNIIFLSFIVFSPLIICLILMINERQRVGLYMNFELLKFNINSDVYLEEIYRNACEFYSNVDAKIRFIQIIQTHTSRCFLIGCPCKKQPLLFLDNTNNIDWQVLNNFTQFVFDQIIKICLDQHEIDKYEQYSLKYVTFLEKFQNNAVLSYGILQDIKYNQTMANKNVSVGRKGYSTSFYFDHIVEVIQKRNIFRIQQSNQNTQNKLTNTETTFFSDVLIVMDQGNTLQQQILLLLSFQISFWSKFINSLIIDYDHLSKLLIEMHELKQSCKRVYEKCFSQQQQFSSLRLRLQIIYQVCCQKDFTKIIQLEKLLLNSGINDSIDNTSLFKAVYLYNNQVISLIVRCSPKNYGTVVQNLDQQYLDYFNFEKADQSKKVINNLMPPYFRGFHDHLVMNYLYNGKSEFVGGYLRVFILNGQGHIEPVTISLSNYFPQQSLQEEFAIVAHIRKTSIVAQDQSNLNENNNQGYILLDGCFRIIGLSETIYSHVSSYIYKLTQPSHIMDHSNIFMMIPNLDKQIKDFYQNQSLHTQEIKNSEMFTYIDTLYLNYDPQLNEIFKLKNSVNHTFTTKERLKYINKITQNLEQDTKKQLYGVPIQLSMIQRIVKYYHQGEYHQKLYYELNINLKNNNIEKTMLDLKYNNIKSVSQLKQNEDKFQIIADTNRQLCSLDNIDKSEIPMLSQKEEELIYEEGSISSMNSSYSSIRLIKEFQSFVLNAEIPPIFVQNIYINTLFVIFCVVNVMLIIILLQNQRKKLDCLIGYQENFEIYIKYSLLLQNDNFNKYLWNQQNLINLNQSTLTQTQSDIISQAIIINQQILESQLYYWFQSRQNQPEIDKYYQKQLNINELIYIDGVEIILITQQSARVFFSIINNYFYMVQQGINSVQNKFLISNYKQYNQLINEATNFCNDININDQIETVNIIQYVSYVLIFILVSGMFLQNERLLKKNFILLTVFSLTDANYAQQELKIHEKFLKLLRDANPWQKNRIFDQIMNESMNYVDVKQQSIIDHQRTKQVVFKQILKPVQIKQQFTRLPNILFYVMLSIIFITYMIVIQIQNNTSSSLFTKVIIQTQSLMEFRMHFIDIITNWQYLVINNQQKYYTPNITYYSALFEEFKSYRLEDLINILGQDQLQQDTCLIVDCTQFNKQWIVRLNNTGQLQFFKQGILQDISSIINIINQNNAFDQPSVNFLQQDFYSFFFWGSDVIQQQLLLLTQYFRTQQEQSLNIQEVSNSIVLLAVGAIIVTIISSLLAYKMITQKQRYLTVKECLLFMPFLAQTKLNAANLLRQLKK